jgi:integrase
MVDYWEKEGLAPRTRVVLIKLLDRYYKFKNRSDSEIVALKRMITKQVPPNPPKSLTKAETKKLIQTWDKLYPEHHGLVTIGLHTGMRIGEVMGLRWKDVDIVKGRISVLHSYDGPTKSGKGRLIQISKTLAQSLQKRDNYLGSSVEDLVFRRFDVNPKLKRACGRAGIAPITYHTLRHTFATLALESGQNIKTISTVLGHASVTTTLDIYWSVIDDRLNLEFIE